MQELSRFKTLLGSVSGSSLTPDRLSWIFDKVGFKIDPVGISVIAEFINANVGKKKLSTLLENEKLMGELDALFTGMMSPAETVVPQIPVRSVIRCPHCDLAFSIIDAPGVRDITKL